MLVGVILISIGSVAAIAANTIKEEIVTVDLRPTVEGEPRGPQFRDLRGGANVLLIGSDTRLDQKTENLDAEGARNDVTMLLHISDDHSRVSIVSFPRDTMVPIPSCINPDTGESTYAQTKAMFNSALGMGGPRGGIACVVKTVEALTGLTIPYAGLITFDGVVAMSNALGGVTVCLATPIHDGSFLNLPAGKVSLQGDEALAFLRTRHGVGDGSDLARISNQQVFLSAMLRKLTADGALSNPVTLYKFARAAASNMTLSKGLDETGTMISMATAVRHVKTSNMVLVQYPTIADPENPNRVVVDSAAAVVLNTALQHDDAAGMDPGSIGRGAVSAPSTTAKPVPAKEKPIGKQEPNKRERSASPTSRAPSVRLPPSVTGQSVAERTCSAGTG